MPVNKETKVISKGKNDFSEVVEITTILKNGKILNRFSKTKFVKV